MSVNTAEEKSIREDVIMNFEYFFGLNVHHAVPIKRGWLNLKWKLTTDAGEYLLKQYNKERFRLYNPEDLAFAFTEQERLHRYGLPCPGLLSHHNQVLLESNHGEIFMAMEYCQGRVIKPGRINAIYSSKPRESIRTLAFCPEASKG